MLTVWCVWWRDPANPDKYSEYYVQRLQREVRNNLTVPHRFVCITDEAVDGVATMPPPEKYPGWWAKVGLFKRGVATGHNLFLDLDVVVTGSLDDLVKTYRAEPLAMPSNWARSGHGGCQSSVMLWNDCAMTRKIYEQFDPRIAHWPPINQPGVLWGDQEWITELRNKGEIQVTPMRADWIKSYKYHCTNGLPPDTRVVVFHGDPKPPQVGASWFQW